MSPSQGYKATRGSHSITDDTNYFFFKGDERSKPYPFRILVSPLKTKGKLVNPRYVCIIRLIETQSNYNNSQYMYNGFTRNHTENFFCSLVLQTLS